jgi:hypothetical protein
VNDASGGASRRRGPPADAGADPETSMVNAMTSFFRFRRATVLAGAAVALAACSDSTGSKVGPAAHLDVLSGNSQSAPVGAELPQPLVVKVTDAKGHPVKGQVVNFVVTAGGGHAFAGSSATNDDGIAQERWTVGTAAGAPQTLEVRAVDNATGQALVFATFTATTVAGPPTQATAVGGDTSVVGVPGSVVEDSFAVQVRDQYGNPTPGVQVAWSVTSGGSITSPSTTDAAGIARTQWVLGNAGTAVQGAQATAGGATVRFAASPVTVLTKLAGDGLVQGAGSAITVTVGTNGPGGLPIHWAVASGGGSVAPAVARTTTGAATSAASAQWTLGPAGPQTLTASAGNLSVTFTATAVVAGRRTLLADLNGRILDLDATRVLYVDSSTAVRKVRLRTLSTGSEVVVDSGYSGMLAPDGALVLRGGFSLMLVEIRGGAVTSLGPVNSNSEIPLAVEGNWAAWITAQAGSLIRRDLVAGTNTTLATLGAPNRSSVDVGLNGDVAYEAYIGGGSGGSSYIRLFHDGTVTDVYNSSSVGLARPKTDGGNVTFTTLSLFTGYEQWLWHAGTTERLAQAQLTGSADRQIILTSRHAGGWVAYLGVNQPSTPGQYMQVRLRTPGGADEPVSLAGAGNAALLEALCPDGSVVYSQGAYTNANGASYTRRYIAYRGGPLVDMGPPTGSSVVCRGGRFFLLSGGAGYELSQ